MAVAIIGGEEAVGQLLVLSQVVLSLQLPFAVWPLVYFTSSDKIMNTRSETQSLPASTKESKKKSIGNLLMTFCGVFIALILTILNGILFIQFLQGEDTT